MRHPNFCEHKFVDSKRCLKCGWQPFCGAKKLSHAGCCGPDPNHSLPGHELPAGVAPTRAAAATAATIFKYTLPIDDEFTIMVARGARILSVQTQHDAPQLWAMVDPQAARVGRRFAMRGTGHDATGLESAAFVGTFQISGGALVFHLFDLGEAWPRVEIAQ